MEVFIWSIPSNAARPSVRRKAREETLNLQKTELFSKASSGMLTKSPQKHTHQNGTHKRQRDGHEKALIPVTLHKSTCALAQLLLLSITLHFGY